MDLVRPRRLGLTNRHRGKPIVMDTLPSSPLVREEHLQKLAPFCRALGEALKQAGLASDQAEAVWRTSVTGECVLCGIRVTGDELSALTRSPDKDPSEKIERLRLGDCARRGCDSFYYRLTFQTHPPLDWTKVLAQVETINDVPAEEAPDEATDATVPERPARSGLVRRLCIAVAIVVVLLLARQWYLGGRIPLVREPEHFKVDPAPPGSALR